MFENTIDHPSIGVAFCIPEPSRQQICRVQNGPICTPIPFAPAGAWAVRGPVDVCPCRRGPWGGCVGRLARVNIWRKGGRVRADGHFVARTAAALPAPPEAPCCRRIGASVLAQYFVSSQYWFSIHDQMDLFIGPGFTRDACRIYRSAAGCYRRTYSVCTGVDFARCHFAFLRVVPS